MSGKDYTEKATKKIIGKRVKAMVRDELFDHFELKKDRFEEIGFDSEAAEYKTLEAMGDTDTIAEQFGMLHNDFYNPVFDVIFYTVWYALLGAAYYFIQKYLFGDMGTMSALIAAVFISISLFWCSAAVSAKRNRLTPIIGTLLGGIATAVFDYFILTEINRMTDSDFSVIKNFILNTALYARNKHPDRSYVTIAIAIFAALALLVIAAILAYHIKIRLTRNSLTDNKLHRVVIRISAVICVLVFAGGTFFCMKFFNDIDKLRSEYLDAYDFVIELSENCKTPEEALDYIDKSEYDFVAYRDSDGNIDSCDFSKNLVAISITFNEQEDKYGLSTSSKYAVYLSIVTRCFDATYDSLTLSPFKASDNELDELHSFMPFEHSKAEQYAFYKTYIPSSLKFKYYDEDLRNSYYQFQYMGGKGDYKFIEYFDITLESQKLLDFYEKEKEITEIVKQNKSKSLQEIAKLTDTTLSMPDISREDYEKGLNMLGSYFDDYKENALDAYDAMCKFEMYDGWYFSLGRYDGN